MNNLIKIGLFVVIVFALLTFFEIKDVESQARPTATKSRTRTATATASITPSVTATNTITPSPTVTSSPTTTLTPSPTPVQKTEIKVFDGTLIETGKTISSSVIDVTQFNEVSLFLLIIQEGYSTNATCYFVPNGESRKLRFQGTTIQAATNGIINGTISVNSSFSVFFSRVLGPKMFCEVTNKAGIPVNVDLYLYLIP